MATILKQFLRQVQNHSRFLLENLVYNENLKGCGVE